MTQKTATSSSSQVSEKSAEQQALQRGRQALQSGDVSRARNEFEKAVRLAPNDAFVVRYHLANIPFDDIDVITSAFPIPGFGKVPINAFVIKGPEPILVDTGAVVESADFMRELRSVIDPTELRWL